MPSSKVAQRSDIPSDAGLRVKLPDGTPVALFDVEGDVFAIGDTCSHEEASLSDGFLEEGCLIECPKHGAQFDLRTGQNKTPPATRPVPSYPVRLDGDDIYLEHD